MRGGNFRNILTINVKILPRESLFFDAKLSNSSDQYYFEPSLYHSITDIVEAMNTLIQEKQSHKDFYRGQFEWKNAKS